jgi:hypothetical protein
VNCCGVLTFGYSGARGKSVTPQQAARITIKSTIPGPSKEESPADKEWRIYVRLPREVLAEMCGKEIAFADKWRGNFYRCGGITDKQYVCWQPIISRGASFHAPEQFGWFVFE